MMAILMPAHQILIQELVRDQNMVVNRIDASTMAQRQADVHGQETMEPAKEILYLVIVKRKMCWVGLEYVDTETVQENTMPVEVQKYLPIRAVGYIQTTTVTILQKMPHISRFR